MHKYLTIMLLSVMIFGVSCGLVDEYIGNSETAENSEPMQESASFEENDMDEENIEKEDEMRMEKEEEMRMEKEEEMRMEKEEEMRIKKEDQMRMENDRMEKDQMRMEKDQMKIDRENARLIKESVNVVNGPSFKYFDRYADIETLRIFALPEVSDEYLRKVGAIFKLMFDDNSNIDKNLQNEFFQTMKDNYVYQRVGYKGPELYDMDGDNPKIDCCPENNYDDNQTDYIWEPEGQGDPTGEIIEHALHTITNVAFKLMSSDWDYADSGSKLRLAYKEAVDKKLFNEESYAPLKGGDDFYKVTTQEYFFWVIVAEWDLGFLWDLPNEEFLIKNKEDLSSKLPMSHQMFQSFVEKILSPPKLSTIEAIININME